MWSTTHTVVDWVASLVSHHNSQKKKMAKSRELESKIPEDTNTQSQSPDQMMDDSTDSEDQNYEIIWLGDSTICEKKLTHYPAFIRDEHTITVHSFAFIMGKKGIFHIGYVEDLYENHRKRKMVKVRWFHRTEEVSGVINDPRPNELIMTPDVQAVSAECVDGVAVVLTPKHYEQCLAVVPEGSDGIFMCYRQIKRNNKVTPFPLCKLRGYSNQSILSNIFIPEIAPQQQIPSTENKEVQASKEVTKLVSDNKIEKTRTSCHPKWTTGDAIEVLSLDSGIRGCWFECRVLKATDKWLYVMYVDLEDVERHENLEEWIAAHKIAGPDKLGMRWLGRHTIRPSRAQGSCSNDDWLSVGAPVDAWWCDAWWEGVIVETSTNSTYRVYFPGENIFQNIDKKDLRKSKEWVDNKWVEIKSKPDIVSFLSSETEAAENVGQELPGPGPINNVNEGQIKLLMDKT